VIQASQRRGVGGFSLVEAIAAILILSLAGSLAARFMLSTGRAVTQVRRLTQASGLSQSVFEQYTSHAAADFYNLAALNATHKDPKDFFQSRDNLGFDGLKITSRADYADDKSSCTVQVAIEWQQGPELKTYEASKAFFPQNAFPLGAEVQVEATANGAGVPGLSVSAPSVKAGSTTATTDGNGVAPLHGVLPGSGIAVQVNSTLVDYDVPAAAPGYYVPNGATGYSTLFTTYTTIEATHLNVVPVTAFVPTGQIIGRVVNDDDPAVVGGLTVSLDSNALPHPAVFRGGAFHNCGLDLQSCSVKTQADGSYHFNNVVPSSVVIYADGALGSVPMLKPGDAGFHYGYTNPLAWAYESPRDWTVGPVPTLSATLHIRRMGWMTVTPTYNGGPLAAGSTIQAWVSYPSRITYDHHYETESQPRQSSSFYNVVLSTVTPITLMAESDAAPAYYGLLNWSCSGSCMAVNNDIALPMRPGYTLRAQLEDKASPPLADLSNIKISPDQFINAPPQALSDHDGWVALDRFSPLMGRTYYSGDDRTPSLVGFVLSRADLLIPATLNGRTIDADTGATAPHVNLNVYADPGIIQSDGDGQFTVNRFQYYEEVKPYVACPAVPGDTCYPAKNKDDTRVVTIRIDTSGGVARIGDPKPCPMGGSVVTNLYRHQIKIGQTISNLTMTAALKMYQVRGIVTEAATEQPVRGMQILDAYTNALAATTGADGSYLGWFTVVGRSAAERGYVSLRTVAQTVGGHTYSAISALRLTIPPNPDPNTVPLVKDLRFNEGAGGGI
jgi:type II secretory pathway pseudopilin PulG